MRTFAGISICFQLTILLVLGGGAHAQVKKNDRAVRKTVKTPAASEESKSGTALPSPVPPKRNERPDNGASDRTRSSDGTRPEQNIVAAYEYEYTRPDFAVSYIKIIHDKDGAGTISFRKKGSDELITDPIRVPAKSVARINDALIALNFLESSENYQYEKDFSHLGNVKFTHRGGGRSREVTLNWTENKDAKVFIDEYRKIGNQFIWIFDISLSRENQPLESPRLLDSLDSMIRRNEIADPHQMEQFLSELSNDERIPLIARNHAAKLVKQIEKEKAKEEKKRAENNN